MSLFKNLIIAYVVFMIGVEFGIVAGLLALWIACTQLFSALN